MSSPGECNVSLIGVGCSLAQRPRYHSVGDSLVISSGQLDEVDKPDVPGSQLLQAPELREAQRPPAGLLRCCQCGLACPCVVRLPG